MAYKITLENFEGPLDLLLFLIKKDDINICDIPIASITDQYLEYIDMMKMLDLEMVGDFLVMAATLIQIKSRMLLPPDPLQNADQEDPRSELVRRLQEYEQFKLVAEQLKQKEIMRHDLFSRIVDQEKLDELIEDSKEVSIEATLFDLINAFSAAMRTVPEQKDYQITQEEFTIEGKIHTLLHVMVDHYEISLTELFGRCVNKQEIICTFVAVLELVRLHEIIAIQRRQFDDIVITRNQANEAVHNPETSS